MGSELLLVCNFVIVPHCSVQMKEERLRRLFDEYGQITECSLKYTKDGVFRKFAFVGFHSESAADTAVTHRNSTYIDTAKIQVQYVFLPVACSSCT